MVSFMHRACAVFAGALLPLALALSLVPHETLAATYPGTILAQFSVGDQGDAKYLIPIDAPAATGGVKPNLALSYNHLAGLGVAGVGWNLSGASAITRCNRTYAQDGGLGGFIYDGGTGSILPRRPAARRLLG